MIHCLQKTRQCWVLKWRYDKHEKHNYYFPSLRCRPILLYDQTQPSVHPCVPRPKIQGQNGSSSAPQSGPWSGVGLVRSQIIINQCYNTCSSTHAWLTCVWLTHDHQYAVTAKRPKLSWEQSDIVSFHLLSLQVLTSADFWCSFGSELFFARTQILLKLA